ncbi:hypothetical protein Pyn_23265 [Prunus yedoensis var. nudiflora]|uniref:Uncharacterized protein n=1 Tax=Prunus yedoensis var. nudiflora TaxID=2094558 RepID=A0A314XM20_PRUYE|nr:hypothetical protein Pyn_36225 [Prunus yedoensis var. nudiflora]PQQ06583.1 hypothetical protein Pyn_23265 [Prunus yedoensis var. nudiflora]
MVGIICGRVNKILVSLWMWQLRVDGLNVSDEGTSFSVVVDTLDGDAYDEFEDNDEDLNGNYEDVDEDSDGTYEDNDEDVKEDLIANAKKRAKLKFQFLDSDYEQSEQRNANQEVNVDDREFDK